MLMRTKKYQGGNDLRNFKMGVDFFGFNMHGQHKFRMVFYLRESLGGFL